MSSRSVVERTGELVPLDPERIRSAILRTLAATRSHLASEELDLIISDVLSEIDSRFSEFFPNVENLQDIVEKHLVVRGHYEVAKAYILDRAERERERDRAKKRAIEEARLGRLAATKRDGRTVLFSVDKIEARVRSAAVGRESQVEIDRILGEVLQDLYDGIPTTQVEQALVGATLSLIERDPAYSYVAAGLLLQRIYKEVLGRSTTQQERAGLCRTTFPGQIQDGVASGLLDQRMHRFDLDRLAAELEPQRDLLFQYSGVQTLFDRYFLKSKGRCLESPQGFWMRVSMGLALEEEAPNECAIEFYDVLSQLLYLPSSLTLVHAGTPDPYLSSSYLTTVEDDLQQIFKCLGDNAQLSKEAAGVGTDWTNVRGTGSFIGPSGAESQGVVPFLKIANDATLAINRRGQRRATSCAYLETWHYDIEDFLELHRNTGDDRRRTHDMSTANWIPDLFMKRVEADGDWTLFSPDEASELHHIYGRKFEERYCEYEAAAERGEIRLFKKVRALDLWRKMLTHLFETGYPWMTFKDACNVRSPQDHVGVIYGASQYTESTLNTSTEEAAVCTLGSVDLGRHIVGKAVSEEMLAQTVRTAIHMLDNAIDLSRYPTKEARNSNSKHRPIGLGVMGFQDALYRLNLSFESEEALEFADATMELISYHAILASSALAAARGSYPSFAGSKWERGLLPIDTLGLLEKERGVPVQVSSRRRLDWDVVRESLRRHGMRNSNTMAIAPTSGISIISGCFPCIEPAYKNIYVKIGPPSTEFVVVNGYLVQDLKARGLWNEAMLDMLKYRDGDVSAIDVVPKELKEKYREAFDVDPIWCLKMTAARAKWIDQSESANVFMRGASGKKLSEIYVAAWQLGLKTTFYLRTMAGVHVARSVDAPKRPIESRTREDRFAEAVPAAPQLARVDDELALEPRPWLPETSAARVESELLAVKRLKEELRRRSGSTAAGPTGLPAELEQEIEELYSELATYYRAEASDSAGGEGQAGWREDSKRIRDVWDRLRALQSEEARYFSVAFNRDLAMPADSGRQVLTQLDRLQGALEEHLEPGDFVEPLEWRHWSPDESPAAEDKPS